ncbi:MAG: diaminopimelate epimerase [Acidimicrobiales bacterium]
MHTVGQLRLTKHHGAGNDFLVLLDGDGGRPLVAAEVRALCDRRRGVGADGMLRATPGRAGASLSMELRNADGGAAEMSGNGIRCLVQAAVDAGWVQPGHVEVDTAAGRRRVEYRRGRFAGLDFARVSMGTPVLGDELQLDEPTALRSARAVDMGNPHLVLLLDGPAAGGVVASVGPRLERSVPGGANVEFVWEGPGPGELTLRVWERGVGETQACGTGTCAAAAAAAAWGLVARQVPVHNPGGTLEVELTADGAVLGGPTVSVAMVEVDEAVLSRLAESALSGPAAEVAATR